MTGAQKYHNHFMDGNKSFLDRQPVFLQLLMLVGIILACTLIFTLLSLMLVKPLFGIVGADTFILKAQTDPESLMDNPNGLNALKFIQLVSSIGTFLVPAIIFGFTKKMRGDYLKLATPVTVLFSVLSVLALVTAIPFVGMLDEWNHAMHLPASMKTIEDMMKSSEELAAKVTSLFLIMPTVSDFLFSLLVVGIAPALAEEFLFRGVLQQLFREWFKNIHVAIWTTAILFSAIHFQFYGFFPRMALGALLGYLFFWSGSLWVPIIGHAVNNGGQVILAYLHRNGTIAFDIESNTSIPVYITVIFTLLLVAVLYVCHKKKVNEPVETAEPVLQEPIDSNIPG